MPVFTKRLTAYILDYLIISFLVLIACMIIPAIFCEEIYGDFPFVIIYFIYFPISFWTKVWYWGSLSYIMSWLPLVIVTSIITESLLYALVEWKTGQTFGKKIMKLRVISDGRQELGFFLYFFRNLFKCASKYLLGVPFLFALFNKKRKTLYDSFFKCKVIDLRSYTGEDD